MTPRVALEAALSPLVAQLSDLDGRRYLRLINQLASHPAYFREVNVTFAASLLRAAEHIVPLVEHLDEDRRLPRVQNTIGMLLYSLALQARLTDAEDPPIPPLDPPVFLEDLLDAVEGVLARLTWPTAPVCGRCVALRWHNTFTLVPEVPRTSVVSREDRPRRDPGRDRGASRRRPRRYRGEA